MAENVLETPRNRGQILGCGTIMVTPLNIEWRHRGVQPPEQVPPNLPGFGLSSVLVGSLGSGPFYSMRYVIFRDFCLF